MEEASWTASIKSIGSLIAYPLFGIIANKGGRKWPIAFLSIPAAVRHQTKIFIQYTLDIFSDGTENYHEKKAFL